MNELQSGWMDRQMDEWLNVWMDEWKHKFVDCDNAVLPLLESVSVFCLFECFNFGLIGVMLVTTDASGFNIHN